MAESADEWAVVELMGHVRIAGLLTEVERFGTKLGRLDIPKQDGTFVTQYFGGSAVYRVTLVTEEAAREVARQSEPRPAYRAQLLPVQARCTECNSPLSAGDMGDLCDSCAADMNDLHGDHDDEGPGPHEDLDGDEPEDDGYRGEDEDQGEPAPDDELVF